MAANALRLRRSLALTSTILNRPNHFSSALPSVAAPPSSTPTIQTNHSLFDVTQSKSNTLPSQFMLSRAMSSRSRYNNDEMDGDQISPDAILFEGCDYNHWLITMDFPKDPKPSPEEMVETYVQTAAKVLGSVEEAKKKIYACSTTTYQGFQVEVSEEVSEQFKGLPGVVFVLPDSYIDPVNKEYGGDKYINGTIIPRPPPVQYGRQGGRYNDRNREYNRPPRGQFEQNNASGGQGNYQRGPMPSNQGTYNQGAGRSFPQRDQGNYSQGGGYNQGAGGGYRQGPGGQYGPGGGGQYGPGGGGQYGPGGGGQYGPGGGGPGGPGGPGGAGQYGQGGGGQGVGGQYGQMGGGQGVGGQYGQGTSGPYGQGTGGQYRQGTGGQYGQGGGQYGQDSGQPRSGADHYRQGGGGGNYGQGGGGGNYRQGTGYGGNQTAPQYGENPNFSQAEQRGSVRGQEGNYEAVEEAEAFKGR